MNKRAPLLETLRKKAPTSIREYIRWLEERVVAITRLRLLDMSDAVDKSIALQDRYTNQFEEQNETDVEIQEPEPEIVVPKQKTKKGFVYLLKVIGHDNLYKIGRTKNPKNRIRTFSVKLPYPVRYEHVIKTDNMYSLENKLHTKFRKTRQNGSEFFLLSDSDVRFIKSSWV